MRLKPGVGKRIAQRAILALCVAATTALTAPAAGHAAGIKAGAASVDASWHVGASAGQYASDGTPVDPANGNYDPTTHSTRRASSYGIQSRLQARAIVIEGPDGRRMAIVKNDLYIPQDLLYRRTAQILEGGSCGIDRKHLTMAVTHDHSSPYYSSPSWGVWAFQDVFDVRFYDYYARQMAAAVEQACSRLVSVRVGASVSQFDKTHRHSFGPQIADDGTPAGYPQDNTDHDMTVVRFDDLSGHTVANLVNFSLHPEFLEGNDLISADYVAPLQRMVDKETGGVTLWTQGAVGTAEPERSTYHSIHERLEFTHKEYAQAEYGARLMADTAIDTWRDIERGTPENAGDFVGFQDNVPLQMDDRWYPGPFSHPYPGVSNCRTDKGLSGDPQLPVVGLPDCQGVQGGLNDLANEIGIPPPSDAIDAIDPGLTTDDFQSRGIPVPENYAAPSYTGLQEDIDIHLQVIRLGEILLPVCSCEQWFDQSENIETRLDMEAGNEHLGYDWGAQCTDNGNGTWTCPDPRTPSTNLPPIPDHEFMRMRAQVRNKADGWNNAENAATAESEPTDTTQIKGNYTHDDTPGHADAAENAQRGYELVVPISQANDYNGYIATYREFQRGDHYRKALTGWGPHSSDYMASRLVTMGRRLKDPGMALPTDQQQEQPLATKAEIDTAINDQRATALGSVGGGAIAGYEAGLPDDGGSAEAITQPSDFERFSATSFTWNGGSNFTDNPEVKVQRRVKGDWVDYAGQSGEIPVTLKFPAGEDVASYTQNDQRWEWTAHFEAFGANFTTIEGNRSTPAGTYRFAIAGNRRQNHQVTPYTLMSDGFAVKPWPGITVEDLQVDGDGRVSFRVGPRRNRTASGISGEIGPIDYPDSYTYGGQNASRLPRFIRVNHSAQQDSQGIEWYCFTCTFRPWADFGNAETVKLTFAKAGAPSEQVAASEENGRWVSERALANDESAFAGKGCVQDRFGDYNGDASQPVGGGPGATGDECQVNFDEGAGDDDSGGGGSNGGSSGGQAGQGGSGQGGQQGGEGKLRLRFVLIRRWLRTGRPTAATSARKGCARAVVAKIVGADANRVRNVEVFIGKRRRIRDKSSPFRGVIGQRYLRKPKLKAKARVILNDGRVLSFKRSVRICRNR